jgi:catechol 2,3-dioxygenase-like lactoylglutathione lyase family enzyme
VPIDALTPYAHVADVRRSVDFYRHLGLEVQSAYESEGKLVWALVARPGDTRSGDRARLMLAQANGPVDAPDQAVLFYCWALDIKELHDQLTAAGVDVGDVEHPFYMPAGEFRALDPDGYVLLIGQLDTAA